MDEYVTRYERLKAGERYFSVNNDKWITVKGNHILLKDDETPEQAIKRVEIRSTIDKVLNQGIDEVIVKDVRTDLEQYGGNNNVAFIKGNIKGGLQHIDSKHKDDIDGVVDALIKGEIIQHVPNRKIKLSYKGYIAFLSLDFNGNKKTWLLTGYKEE